MIPKVLPTILLDEWVIATKYTVHEGFIIASVKYPIPKDTLKHIAYDFLVKEANDCKKGYTFELTNRQTNEVFKVTVERMVK